MKQIEKGLIVSDFDGTLLTSRNTILPQVKSAISEYVQAGGIFAVCTGRMLASILPRVRELGLKGLVIAYQGTVIADIESGKIIKQGGYSARDAADVCRVLKGLGQPVNVYSDNVMYTDIPKENEYLKAYERITGIDSVSVQNVPMADYVLQNKLFCQKITVLVSEKERVALYEALQKSLGSRFDVTCSASVLVEISPKGDDKGGAVRFLAKHYGIGIEDTVAVGDNLNDISMIRAAGVGVAVGNAIEELKREADFIAATNDEGAVAQIIYRYGFKD